MTVSLPPRSSFLCGALLLSSTVACGPNEPAAAAPAAPAQTAAPPAPANPAAEKPALRSVTPAVSGANGTFLPPLTTAITSFGAASANGTLYLLGGYSGIPHAYSREGQSADVLAFDVTQPGSFTKIATMNQALQGVPAVSFDGRLCHFGGSHASNAAGEPTVMTSVTEARCLSLADKTWSDMPALPKGLSSHAAALVGSTVYLVGGWTLSGKPEGGVFNNELFSLDLKKPTAGWVAVPAPFGRRAVGVGSLGKSLVVVGGMSSEGQPLTLVDVYYTATKTWSKGPDFPGDAFGIAVSSNGKLVYASGREGQLRSFAPGQKTWSDVRKLAYGRFFHQLLQVGDDLVVLGGIGGMHSRGRTRAIERVSLKAGLAYGQMTFEYPGIAKNRQGIMAHGEQILLFGGNDSLEQHDFSREHFESESWVFDLATLEFHETTPFVYRRQSMQVVETEAGGISIGGFGHEPLTDARSDAVSHAEVIGFDWDKAAWSPLSSLPRGRTQFGVAQNGRDLWIFGGLNYDPSRKGKDAFDHDRSIWKASFDDAKVNFEATDIQLPGPRRAFAGALFEGKYVIVGGMKEGFDLVEGCLEFDFQTKAFSDFPCPAARLSGDLIAAGGKLLLVGGSVQGKDGVEESRKVEIYEPKTKKWSTSSFEIPFTTRHMRALPYRDQVLLLSTHSQKPELTVGLISP